MRGLFMAAVALPLALSFSTSLRAEQPIVTACKAYAAAVADDYMSDRLLRVDDAESAPRGYITTHVAGHKYVMPATNAGQNGIRLRAIGENTIEWGRVYSEERRRCLRQKLLGDLSYNN